MIQFFSFCSLSAYVKIVLFYRFRAPPRQIGRAPNFIFAIRVGVARVQNPTGYLLPVSEYATDIRHSDRGFFTRILFIFFFEFFDVSVTIFIPYLQKPLNKSYLIPYEGRFYLFLKLIFYVIIFSLIISIIHIKSWSSQCQLCRVFRLQ